MRTPPALRRRMPQLRLVIAAFATVAAVSTLGATGPRAAADHLPQIRLSSANTVPRCVTPDRLMRFLTDRNSGLDPRFRDIAKWYRHHGEAWKVRWDYAFFQMLLETNYLTYRRPDGRWGDVDPRQNNFAGIGTTGGGVPGDRFPDVSTGVLAQIQHLVAYSGEYVARPVAPRTALKQEHIVSLSRRLERPVRYSDLAKRWAVDPRYGFSIGYIASLYQARYCRGGGDSASGRPERRSALPAPKPRQVVRTVWRRGDPEQTAAGSAATRDAPVPVPVPAATRVAVETQATSALRARVAGWAAMAAEMRIALVVPAPRLAQRPAVVAVNP